MILRQFHIPIFLLLKCLLIDSISIPFVFLPLSESIVEILSTWESRVWLLRLEQTADEAGERRAATRRGRGAGSTRSWARATGSLALAEAQPREVDDVRRRGHEGGAGAKSWRCGVADRGRDNRAVRRTDVWRGSEWARGAGASGWATAAAEDAENMRCGSGLYSTSGPKERSKTTQS